MTPSVHFVKMQGAGNDYVYLDRMDPSLPPLPVSPSELACRMSPRHTSVGADGLVLILPSVIADARMKMFNADGTEGNMCGNAIRCVGKYLFEAGYVSQTSVTIETNAGIKWLKLHLDPQNNVTEVTVDMGTALIKPSDVPLLSHCPLINAPLSVLGQTYPVTAMSIGNPHAVIFLNDLQSLNLPATGAALEHHPCFPDRVNVEFVKITNPSTFDLRVWERGSGETFACGTGACASVAAAVLQGKTSPDTPVTVRMKGGSLTVTCTIDLHLFMTGDAVHVYDGIYAL